MAGAEMNVSPLWRHQEESINRFKDRSCGALFHDPGVGKTRTTIELLRHKYRAAQKVVGTLIFAPVIVLDNWKEEFAKYSKVNPDQVVVLKGATIQRRQLLREKRGEFGDSLVVVTNYEGIVSSKELFQDLATWQPEILVVDECQKCKAPASKRTKLITKLADGASCRYILSGTPVLNSALDIYAQFRILDRGETFGTNFYIFRSVYFYDKNSNMPKQKYFPNWVIREGSIETMNKKISEKATRVLKSECLDLPPLIKKKVFVELSPQQEKLYSAMKKELIAYLDTDAVTTAQIAITKALRLQQIITGYIKTDDGKEVSLGSTPRITALAELLEEITPAHKVIVWCVFRENYAQVRRVCEELKLEYVEAHGDVPDKKKFEAVSEFNRNATVRVFIGHPGSLGIGVNICSASYSIYFSRNFSLEMDIQSQARNYRGGSEVHEKITRVDIVAKDTIDELILEALDKKEEIGLKMLQEIKERL